MLDRMLKRLQCPEEGIRQSVPCSDDIDTKRGLLHFLKRAHGFSLKRDCIAFVAFLVTRSACGKDIRKVSDSNLTN